MIAQLEKLTRAEFSDEPEATHLDYAEARIASGTTILALAAEISKVIGLTISREMLSKYLTSLEERNERAGTLVRARTRGAHALAEGALMLAEDVPADRDEIARAKLQIDTQLFVASRWNRDELGDNRGANVQISFNLMHLDALRARATGVVSVSPVAQLPAGAMPNETEAIVEVIEDA